MPDELFSSLEKLQSVQGVLEIPAEIGRGIEKPVIDEKLWGVQIIPYEQEF